MTVKHYLFKTLGRFTPSFSEFITFLSDIQKILNNRPLTYHSCENEIDIISPNHFLMGRPIPSLVFGDSEQVPEWEYHEEDEYSSLLAQTLEFRDSMFENYKDRWLKDYLVNLREKDRATYHSHREWKKGEIALYKLPSKSRSYWPLVRIVEISPNEEGILRIVLIAKPLGKEVTVNVSHLILLELYSELNNPNLYDVHANVSEVNEDFDELYESAHSEVVPEPSSTRPSRRTAEASRAQTRTLAGKGLL